MKGDAGAGPTFAQIYTAIISKQCLPCHATGGGAMMGKLDMSSEATAYTNLVGAMAMGSACMGKGTLVVKGDSATSILYSKLSKATPICGTRMPHAPGRVTMGEIMMVMRWIDGGAAM
jgi:hypothetical protein